MKFKTIQVAKTLTGMMMLGEPISLKKDKRDEIIQCARLSENPTFYIDKVISDETICLRCPELEGECIYEVAFNDVEL